MRKGPVVAGAGQPKRIAVTGGAGFIGSHVVDRLAAAGHDVVVLDVRRPHRNDVGFEQVDVLDLEALRRGLRECDAVFHLAGVANVNEAAADPVRTTELNVTATARVWEAARDCVVRRAVLASTVWVYGAAAGEGPVDEDAVFDLTRIGHIYTASKVAAELVVRSCHELYGQEFTILRYGIPYGPRMRDELVVARFVQAALAGKAITVHGDGSQYRNYVYVEDLAEAHVLALGDAGANEVFNLEGRESVTVRCLVDEALALTSEPVSVTFGESRAGDFAGRPVSANRAKSVLGWEPQVPFAEGLRRYVAWHLASAGTPSPTRRSWAAPRLSPAAAALVLPALAVHAFSLKHAVVVVGLIAGAILVARRVARCAPRPVPSSGAALVGLAGVWLVSQAEGVGVPVAMAVLALGVGMCMTLTRRIGGAVAAASALGLLGLSLSAWSTLAWWLGAAIFLDAARAPAQHPLRWPKPAVAVSFSAIVAVATLGSTALVGATSARASWFGQPVQHASRTSARVALTVDTTDDATASTLAPRLDAQGLRATFFLAGSAVRSDPSVVASVVARNQGVGAATRDRSLLASFDLRGRAIGSVERNFQEWASVCPAFVRRGGGYSTPLVSESARRRGMEVVGWDVAVDASREPDPAHLAQRVLQRVRGGSIVRIDLTHGGPEAVRRVDGALPLIHDGLAERRLESVPLDVLLSRPAYLDSCPRLAAR